MKKTFSIIAVSIALITLLLYGLFYWSINVDTDLVGESGSIDIPSGDTAFGGVFYNPHPNDSLPYFLYRKQEDSLKQIKQEKDLINRGVTGSGMSWWFVGVHQVKKQWHQYSQEKRLEDQLMKRVSDSSILLYNKRSSTNNADSIRFYKELEEDMLHRLNVMLNTHGNSDTSLEGEDKHLYYFELKNYELDFDSKFYLKDSNYYLAYVVWDTAIKEKYKIEKRGHYESMELPFRYSSDNKALMYPISKHQYKNLFLSLQLVGLLQLCFIAYFIVGLPCQIIWNISRGRAFTQKNYRRLKMIGLIIILSAFISHLTPYIVNCFLANSIPKQFKMSPFLDSVFSYLLYYFIGVAVFVLGLAFQRGYNLQQEQNLTI